MPKSSKYIDAEYRIVPESERDPHANETYESVMRLLVGSLLLGSEEVLKRTRAWEEANPRSHTATSTDEDVSDLVLLRHLLVGAIFLGPELISHPLIALAETADRAFGLAGSLLSPFLRIPLFKPARGLWEGYRDRLGLLVDEFIEKGRREEPYSKAMARDLLPQILSETAAAASEQVEGIQALVRDQVSKYLAYVQENPEELEALVQLIGDRYLAYLKEENPEALQAIIQGQSLSLAGEVTDELRARTVTADSIVEMFMRSLLRRPARQELPLPPPEVLAQARMSTSEVISRRHTKVKKEP
ncbi:MAG TPA: hypothetical protein ENK60_08065 [Anaerolineae bacterium]|nr:hypothetical protein [Anaerolineae bacterium]